LSKPGGEARVHCIGRNPVTSLGKLAWWAATAVAILALAVVAANAKEWVNADAAMYLYTADLILDGKVPYVDFVEVNPPLVMYWSVLPMGLARALGASSVSIFNALVMALAGLGVVSLARYLRATLPELSEAHRHLAALAWLGFSFYVFLGGVTGSAIVASVPDHFGQREHLFALAFLPFLLLRWARWDTQAAPCSRAEAIAVGVLAGLGTGLKPYFAAVPVAIELHGLLKHGRPRVLWAPEVLAFVGVGAAYVLHFFLVPGLREAFLGHWLPLTAERYAAYHSTWEHVLGQGSLHAALVLLFAWLLPWDARYKAMLRRVWPLASFLAGSAIAMVAQHKGWTYHQVTLHAGVWLTLTLVGVQILEDQRARLSPEDGKLARVTAQIVALRPMALATLLAAWCAIGVRESPLLFKRYQSPTLDVVRAHSKDGDAVLYVASTVSPAFPEMLLAHRKPGSRYLWSFPLAYVFAGVGEDKPLPPAREAEAAVYMNELGADVRQHQPRLVMMWAGMNAACPPEFSIPHFLEDRGFIDEYLVGYTRRPNIGMWVVFAKGEDETAPAPEVTSPRRPQNRPSMRPME
jgi:hypothetical protein